MSLRQVNRIKSSVEGYKTLLSRTKLLKSNSNTSNQNQSKCKRAQNIVIKSKATKK